jgi:hypothetical protein
MAKADKHLQRVRKICAALPESSEKPSHGEPTFFVGKKVFAMYSNNHHNDGHIAVLLPAAPGHQENMIADDPETYYRPPYVGVRGWVGVDLDRIGDEELRTLIHNAWRLIAPKRLTIP